MKKILSMFMTVVMVIGCFITVTGPAFAADEIKTVINFDADSLPGEFTRYGGAASVASGISADGTGNSCLLKPGAIYYINDGNAWVNFNNIYFNADVRADEGATFMCFGTHRFRTDTPFVSFSNGNIIVGGINKGTYVPGQWYNVTAVVDRIANTIDVWVDGTKIADDISITFNNADASMYIGFNTSNSSADAYIDNITLSDTVPAEYTETALKIISSTPADGTQKLAVADTQVSVEFNYALNEETIENSISINNGATVSDVSYDSALNSVVFKVTGLEPETSYTITFSNTLSGVNGEKFGENPINTISFTTDVAEGTPISTVVDFNESTLPSVFVRYGGAATIKSGMASDGVSNACYMQYGSTYYINDGNSWVNSELIYFNADVRVESGASFVCFATRRYSGHSPFVTLNNGSILVNTTKVGSYLPDTWYELTAVLDRTTNTIDVWLDGIKLADDVAVNFIHEDENSYIGFLTDKNAGNKGAYIDDITLSNTVPEFAETKVFAIASSAPESGTENVGIAGAQFKVSFTAPVLESSIDGSIIIDNGAQVSDVLYKAETNSVEFTVSNLKYSTVYNITFADTLSAQDGSKFNKFSDAIWFVTEDEAVEEITTVLDFEASELPAEFTRRGGKATVVSGSAADGESNACYLQSGSTYYINDGKAWPTSAKKIYFNADVYAQKDGSFVCLSTQRYATNTPFVSFVKGDILVAGTKVGTYTEDKWYELTATINRVLNTIDVWVNGVKLADNVSITFKNADAGMYIAFATENSASGAYIDDITISNKVPYISESKMNVECADGKIKVMASFNSDSAISDNCKIFIASYLPGEILSSVTVSDNIVITQGLNTISDEFEYEENIQKIRAYLWDGKLVPLCDDEMSVIGN